MGKRKAKVIFIITALLMVVTACRAVNGKDTDIPVELKNAVNVYNAERYPEALDMFISLMQKAKRHNDDHTYIVCTGYIGNIYNAFGDNSSCASYYEKGYNAAKKTGDTNLQSNFLTNLVTAYCRLGDIDKAKRYYSLSLHTPNNNDKVNWQYYIYYNQARIYQAEHKYSEAVKAHRKTLAYAKANRMKPLYSLFQLSEIGNLYILMGENKAAIAMGDTCKAMAERIGSGELLTNAYKMLADGYSHDARPDSARKYRDLFFALNDSVYNTKKFYDARHKLDEYEGRMNMQQITSLNNRISSQLYIIIGACAFLIILAVLAAVIIIKNRQLLQTQRLLIDKNKELEKQDEENQSLLAMYLKERGQSSVRLSDNDAKELLRRINSIMTDEATIANPDFSLQMLADAVGSNTRYVSWVINENHHKTFKQLLNELRIRNACHRLADQKSYGRYTMQAIYEDVGYTNAASFNRAFKKIYGMTPTEYQRIALSDD